jgi:hypothetical protein
MSTSNNDLSLTTKFNEVLEHLENPDKFRELMESLTSTCYTRSRVAEDEGASTISAKYQTLYTALRRTSEMYVCVRLASPARAEVLASLWLKRDRDFADTIH